MDKWITNKGKYIFLLKELLKKDFGCFNSVNLEIINMIQELEEKGLVEFITVGNIIVRARISTQGIKVLKNEIPDDILKEG